MKTKSKSHFFLFSTQILCLLLLFNSCKKVSSKLNADVVAAVLQEEKSFLSQIVREEANAFSKRKEISKKEHIVIVKPKENKSQCRLANLSALLNWNAALSNKTETLSYVIVPILDKMTSFSEKGFEFFRSAIFYKNVNDVMQFRIIEVLSDKDQKLASDNFSIASIAFENSILSKTSPIGTVNASIIFFDSRYNRVLSFKITTGKWQESRINFRSDLAINQ